MSKRNLFPALPAPAALRGAKGSSAPFEATDTLRSTQTAEVVDLLGEGQIGGLVNGLKSIYLDGVPVQNSDDSLNFPEFAYALTLGGPTSEANHEFGDVQTEVGVGVTVLAAVPVVRTISDTTADAVRVTLTVPQLVEQLDSGNRVGTSVDFAIDVQSNGGGYVERWADSITGKASSPYSRAIRLSLTDVGPPPWDVRVRRVTADSASANLVNAFAWASYTAISGVRMLYRNSAVARLVFDAKNFSSIPQRWYDVWGCNDWDIPVNYDPLARTVSGSWNGMWTQGPTNNPAWVIYNLVKHPRYGLGQYVVQLPDKWTLYELALWCDEPLPDGRGGTEPRYSINAWIIEQREALQLLQEICSVFRGVLMHGGSTLTVTWDAPGEPVASYTPANVVDGLFTYSDGSSGAKKTSCTCWYTDRRQAAKREMVTWDDADLVARYGLRNFEINPIGVATPGQALRMAKWALYTAHLEDGSIAFRVGADGATRRLGEVFQVTDPSEAGERLGGRIAAATTTVVELDAPVTLASGETYTLWVTQPHATEVDRLVLEGRTVTTAAGTVSSLTVSPAFSAAPVEQSVWLLEGTDVAPTLWRYASIIEVQGQDGQPEYDVLGVRHVPGKFDLVEYDQPLTLLPTRRLSYTVPPVASVSIVETSYYDEQDQLHISAAVSWPIPAPGLRYVVSWRLQLRQWAALPPTSANGFDANDLVAGVYEVQVQSLNALGQLSTPTGTTATLLGDARIPPDVTGFGWQVKPGQVVLYWDRWADPLYLEHELRLGATWDTAAFGWAGAATDYKLARPDNGTYTVWAKIRSKGGRYSANAVSITVVVDDSIDPAGLGGDLVLEVSGAPLFRFADGTTHTTVDPDLTLTARLINLFGEAEWTATAYDAISGGSSLGAVTLTGTGNARVLTGAAFTAPGTLGSVRRVDVTATLGAASDTQSVYRYDPTVTEPFLYLSNPTTAVPTDEAGLYGDYSRAVTGAAVLDTGVDDTAAWTLSIEPDAGITSTINDGAGPIVGAATVSVAVSASTLDDGVVLIRATKSGETDLTAPFRIAKRKAQGVARLLYFAPREDITLPVDAYGQVTSFTNAWTKAMVRLQDGLDATDQYTFSKTDVGCVSTLTGNRIDITGWVSLGEVDTATSDFYDWAASGWERPFNVFFAGANWVTVGNNNFATWQKVQISPIDDYETWTEVDQGVSGRFRLGAYDQGVLCLFEASTASTALVMRSTDGGATWAAGTALPAPNQWYGAGGGDGYMLVCAQSNTSAARSSDAGASWSSITMPAAGCTPILVGPMMLVFDTMSRLWRSADAGANWTQITGIPAPYTTAKRFKGRVVATYRFISTTSVPYSENDGATWSAGTLESAETAPALIEINGVLYLVGAYLHYSLDGKTWSRGESIGATQNAVTPQAGGVDIDYLPQFNATSGIWLRKELLALSATEAAVHVKAHYPGEEDLEAVLPVQLGAIVPPIRVSNIYPALGVVLAGADGVATNMAQAQFAVTVVESSLTVTSDYTWAWSTTYMTPATGSGATAALTSMDVAQDRGSILFTGTAPGRDNVVLQADIIKIKGETNSGLNIGAAYRVSSATNTFVEFGLTETGEVRRREGAAGSWVRLGRWIDPEGAGVGTGKWVRFRLKGSIDGSSTMGGTFDAWLQLTSARSFSLQDVTSGSHLAEVLVDLADNNTGVGMLNSLVQMELVVP